MGNIKNIITFGTDGWRGIIGDTYTYANVRIISQAYADWLIKTRQSSKPVVVGYDRRFMSAKFAHTVAETVASNGIKVILSDNHLPTPALSLAVVSHKCSSGVMVTASHNPGEWNGVKFKGPFGGSADTDITSAIAKELYKNVPKNEAAKITKNLATHNFMQKYVDTLRKLVPVDKLHGLNLVIDSMHGCGDDIIEQLIGKRNRIDTIRANPDPMFDGKNPEPILSCMQPLVEEVKYVKAQAGFATDGDADRCGVIDSKGRFVITAKVVACLIPFLLEHKKWSGEVIKTVTVSRIIDNVCSHYGLILHETPVGFKYVCKLMRERDILIGGEESGGIGFKNHIPERDGPLVGLMLAEMIYTYKQPFAKTVEDIEKKFGKYFYDRIDLHYKYDDKMLIIPRLVKNPLKTLTGEKVVKVSGYDGIKFWTSTGNWLAVRTSGTEPVVRIYAESESMKKTAGMLNEARERILSRK
ncbi:MAG: phosphoglucomutase/phosphomannomutase family protein [Elusimicrobiota bacterium]